MAELQQQTIMTLTKKLKTCLKDIEFLEERLKSMEGPYLERLFAKDKKMLETLHAYKGCRTRSEKMMDESLWRRIETEDAVWSTWNDVYRSAESRPKHAGSVENERRIKDFERDLKIRVNRREILRQEVRQYEARAVTEAASRFLERRYGFAPVEKQVRFKGILIKKRIKEDEGKYI